MPGPTVEGIHAVAGAYDAAGMRAVVAPMISDRTIYQALPGLLEAFPEPLRARVAALHPAALGGDAGHLPRGVRTGPSPDRVRPGLGPAIPLHCSDPFLTACAAAAEARGCACRPIWPKPRMQQVAALARYGERLTSGSTGWACCRRGSAARTGSGWTERPRWRCWPPAAAPSPTTR
jgi:5-methylthioadenosine/S-adenosylhomocysteine deaminase